MCWFLCKSPYLIRRVMLTVELVIAMAISGIFLTVMLIMTCMTGDFHNTIITNTLDHIKNHGRGLLLPSNAMV